MRRRRIHVSYEEEEDTCVMMPLRTACHNSFSASERQRERKRERERERMCTFENRRRLLRRLLLLRREQHPSLLKRVKST
jgi:hypothetical protein